MMAARRMEWVEEVAVQYPGHSAYENRERTLNVATSVGGGIMLTLQKRGNDYSTINIPGDMMPNFLEILTILGFSNAE